MAFSKYLNGAWQDSDAVKRYSDGAWQDCESAKRYVDGAWQEVWSNNGGALTVKSNTVTTGYSQLFDNYSTFSYYKEMDGETDGSSFTGSIAGSGAIIFVMEGNWTNPTISFDWLGGFKHYMPGDYNYADGTWYVKNAGSIQLYGYTTSGTEKKVNAVTRVGYTSNLETDVIPSSSYSGTLTGNFTQLGLVINPTSYSGKYYRACSIISVSNIVFDDKKIKFSLDAYFSK